MTKRETQVASGIALGHPYRVIAERLGVSLGTVATIAWRMQAKLNVRRKDIPGEMEFRSWR